MKTSLLLALAATATTLAAAPQVAQARDGCGRGYHENRYGRCVLNRDYRYNRGYHRNRVVLTIGQYYPGQGYWDGQRYWRERYRYHNGWRYR